MDLQMLKLDLIHWVTELQDQSLLEKLLSFKDQQTNSLSDVHKQLLDDRIDSYERKTSQVFSWEKVSEDLEKEL